MEQIKAIYKFTEENCSQDEDMTKLLLCILRRFVIHYQIWALPNLKQYPMSARRKCALDPSRGLPTPTVPSARACNLEDHRPRTTRS